MYQAFYNMKMGPFPTQPMPEVFFKSKTHAEALSFIQHGIMEHESFLLVTGEYGLGKTLLCLRLLKSLHKMQDRYYFLYVPTASYTYEMILREMNRIIGFDTVGESVRIAVLQSNLFDFYKKREASAKRFLVIIDDFQEIESSTLHYLKLLANFNTEDGFFPFSLILFAHPLILDRLKPPLFASLQQKIKRHFRLSTLNLDETKEYIYFRLLYSGARGNPYFTDEAIKYIFQLSHGNPRFINNICDASLLIGSRKGKKKIEKSIVAEAVEIIARNQKNEKFLSSIRRSSSKPTPPRKEPEKQSTEFFPSRTMPAEEETIPQARATEKVETRFIYENLPKSSVDFTNIPTDFQKIEEDRSVLGARAPNIWSFGESIFGKKGLKLIIWILVFIALLLFVYRYHTLLFGKISNQPIRYKIDRNYFKTPSYSGKNSILYPSPTSAAQAKVAFYPSQTPTVGSKPMKTSSVREVSAPSQEGLKNAPLSIPSALPATSHKSAIQDMPVQRNSMCSPAALTEKRNHSIKSESNTPTYFYSLILSSHLNRDNAMEEIHRLAVNGMEPVFIRKVFSRGKTWWVIYQGLYTSRKDAEKAKTILHLSNALIRRCRLNNLPNLFTMKEESYPQLSRISSFTQLSSSPKSSQSERIPTANTSDSIHVKHLDRKPLRFVSNQDGLDFKRFSHQEDIGDK